VRSLTPKCWNWELIFDFVLPSALSKLDIDVPGFA
jgi:hypothetical protein